MFYIIKFKHCIAPVAFGILTALCATNEAKAAEVTVKNEDELWEAMDEITENTKIKIDSDYQSDGDSINIFVDTNFDVEIDANNVNFIGESSISDYGEGNLVIKNFLIDGSKGQSEYSESRLNLGIGKSSGSTIFKDSTIKNISEGRSAPITLSGSEGSILMENILLDNNKSENGSGISIDSLDLSVDIDNSTFSNNSTQEGGAAISNTFGSKKLTISNSKFMNNKADLMYEGSGAIYTEDAHGLNNMIIKDSYFENNKSISNERDLPPSSGAITFSRVKSEDSIIISGTTFSNNVGIGGGGAIVFNESEPASTNLELKNSTFYKNRALSSTSLGSNDNDLVNGGAITVYNETETGHSESGNFMKSTNNTFLENKIIRNNNAIPQEDVKGGALGVKGNYMKHEFTNDLFVGNNVENNQIESKVFKNVYLQGPLFTKTTTLGFDNGTETTDTVAQVYGKYPVSLSTNGGKIKAGTKADVEVVPTVMIAPEIGNNTKTQTTGFANMKGTKSLDRDQRGFERKGKSDIGAVEISSLLYDANGGKFTLAELSKYDGKTYYEGKNPAQYAKVGNPGSEFTIINGKTVLKPVKAGKVFLGWSEDKNDKLARTKYNAGKKVLVDDQKVLYAVWKDETYALKYYNNGKTTGTIPTQKNVKPNSEVTIKSQGKLKRKGYKFSGWSTKPSAKKGEAAYAPGKKLKLVKNTKLYAIWKR